MVDKDDWRIMGQEGYLMKKSVRYIKYVPYGVQTHRHCEFCFNKFSDRSDDLHKGYYEPTTNSWICEDCFQDFKDMFQWTVEEDVDDRDLKEVKN